MHVSERQASTVLRVTGFFTEYILSGLAGFGYWLVVQMRELGQPVKGEWDGMSDVVG